MLILSPLATREPDGSLKRLDYASAYLLQPYSVGNFHCIYGARTALADAPPGRLFTFTRGEVTANGRFHEDGPLVPYGVTGTPRITVDLVTGKVGVAMTLVGKRLPPGSGPDRTLGTLSGEGEIDPLTGAFYGKWTAADWADWPDETPPGTFSGGFYGPQGKETAFVFGVSARYGTVTMIGAALAVR